MYQVGVNDFGDVVHVNVHVDQLLEIKINVSTGIAEDAIADVRLHASLFRTEQINDRVRHVEHFRFKQTQQQRLLPSSSTYSYGRCDVNHLLRRSTPDYSGKIS